ncbi:hypothetical protein DK880_00283 [Candidatus Cardinium hertigii]|uniref:Uncharacterized protein n=1 Tax=Candidatus Cardinium hertigii TaxID=247481 RepID=A0A2Z3LGI8_9BACT|nr:hypothetical protein DK880_00283 [Candidatus Cardinium hertigii]
MLLSSLVLFPFLTGCNRSFAYHMGNSVGSEPGPSTNRTYTNTYDFEESAENRSALQKEVERSIIDLIQGGYSCNDPEAGGIIVERLRNDSAVVTTILERLYAKRRAVGRTPSKEEIREVMGACILDMARVEKEILDQRADGSARARAAIAEEAKRLSITCREEYAHNVAKTSTYKDENGKDKKMYFEIGTPKCNLFVFDVLNGAGITAPLNWSGKWPFTASDWHGTANGRFDILDSSTPMQFGDIVATTRHCGIAVDSTYVIAAGVQKVTLDTREKQSLKEGSSIRRYNQS